LDVLELGIGKRIEELEEGGSPGDDEVVDEAEGGGCEVS
jgi:hypothetical protein